MEKLYPLDLWILKIGILGYEEACGLQRELEQARKCGQVGDTLLLLQHPPTVTLGRGAKVSNLLVGETTLKEKGITLRRTDRGGDITYHGPGQIVGYPILFLRDHGLSVSQYMRFLEETLLLTLNAVGIPARRNSPAIGVWVEEKKIASLGVRIRSGVSTHGFALNVNNDLTPFSLINPCGIRNLPVTSLAQLLGRKVDLALIEGLLAGYFASVFKMTIREVSKVAIPDRADIPTRPDYI